MTDRHDSGAPVFDSYTDDAYRGAVADAIRFSGQEHTFFLEAKVRWLLRLTSRRVGDPGTLSFLDFGCGVGLIDGLLVGAVGNLSGVDVAPRAVEQAAAANPGASYSSYDGQRLPYQDESFDVTFAVCVFHHIEPSERARLAAELARVTRPRGLVVVFEHNPFNPLTRLVVSRIPFDDDAVLLSRRETLALLDGAGLVAPEGRYIIVAPWRSRLLDRAEQLLGRVPVGAQYYAAASKLA